MLLARRWKRVVVAGVACAAGLVGVQVVVAGAASAHANAITGVAHCQSDGTYTVDWTVANDYQESETVTVTGHMPGASTLDATSITIAETGDGSLTQTGVPGSASTASITVHAVWNGDDFTADTGGTVTLDGNCAAPPPSKTVTEPTVQAGSCDGTNAVQPTITIPNEAGVDFTLDGTPKSPGTYTVSPGDHVVVASSTEYTLTGQTRFPLTASGPTTCQSTVTPQAPTITQSTCSSGEVPTVPTLDLPSTAGITYSADKAGPYTAGQTVTVTATAHAGDVFTEPAPAGWTYVDPTHETYAVTFADITCATTVTPGTPTVTQSQCASSGRPSAPELGLPSTSGISYSISISGPYTAGQTVVVEAMADSGDTFVGPAPAGWTYVDSSHETYTITFAASPTCAAAVAPSFTDDTCAGTAPAGATVTIPSQDGVEYLLNGDPVSAGAHPVVDGSTITVTAEPLAGAQLVGQTTFTHTYPAAPDCTVTVVPAAATFADDVCSSGHAAGASYTVPASVGVDYLVSGVRTAPGTYPATDGSSVQITAVPQAGYLLSGITEFAHTFTATPDCAVTPAAPTFDPGTCVDGAASSGTYTIPATVGVQYQVTVTTGQPPVTGAGAIQPAGTYPVPGQGTVTVVALPMPGYTLAGATRYVHTFGLATACTTTLIPASVAFQNDSCLSSTRTAGAAVIVPNTVGVLYTIGRRVVAAGTHAERDGSSITVVATARPGYVLTGITQWSHTYPAAPSCSGTDSAGTHKGHHSSGSTTSSGIASASTNSTGATADTGVPTADLLLLAGGSLLAGLLMLALGVRRRPE